ncbi:MAG: prenyltransferase/squalene oxidase repeat-containing protein [Isosphaeraceae bacterium]
MRAGRRAGIAIVIVIVIVIAGASAGWSVLSHLHNEELAVRVDRSLGAALRALVAAQSPDGAWRSTTYGVFKDGLSLTPTVLKAVAFGPTVEGSAAARGRGAEYLMSRVRADGSIEEGPFGITYPVYTASAAVIALSHLGLAQTDFARDAWLRELLRRQLTENLGWSPEDLAFGGWGYSIEPPSRHRADVAPGGQVDADLSSTLFAIGALRIAGVADGDPIYRKALIFIERCQNVAAEDAAIDPRFDDGGFFFSPTDPVRNKAGEAGTDRHGRLRYHSYGSTTADGLRALLRCGLRADDRRVVAARRWLEENFSAASNPGAFESVREVDRDATYFYYAWSVAHAFRALGIDRIVRRGRTIAWAEALARELVRRQRPDGTWSNRFTASKEDEPLVATSFAAGALGNCRTFLAPN